MPPLKRQRTGPRRSGLRPTYRGFAPRQFRLGEWKFQDYAISVAMNTTPTMTPVNNLYIGAQAINRIGSNVSIRSVELRLFNTVTAATGVDQVHRVLLMLDRQCNGVGPTGMTDFLTSADVSGMRNLSNRKRFKCLLDKTFTMNASAEPGSLRFRKFYIKFRRPLVVEYNQTNAGDIGDIVSNYMFLATVASQAAGPTAGAMVGTVRIRFTDM